MLGRDEVDVVAALALKIEHQSGELLRWALGADGLLADVPVLAEDAAQVAQAEEDRPRAIPAAQAVLLAEVGEGAGDPSIPASVTDPRLVLHAVDMAVPGACAAVLQLAQPGGDALGQSTRAVQGQVGGLEGLEQEPGIDAGLKRWSDHGTSHLGSVIGCEFRRIIGDSWQRSTFSSCFQQSLIHSHFRSKNFSPRAKRFQSHRRC